MSGDESGLRATSKELGTTMIPQTVVNIAKRFIEMTPGGGRASFHMDEELAALFEAADAASTQDKAALVVLIDSETVENCFELPQGEGKPTISMRSNWDVYTYVCDEPVLVLPDQVDQFLAAMKYLKDDDPLAVGIIYEGVYSA